MDRSGYLEAAVQRFTEFGGFHPAVGERLPPLVSEWSDPVLKREEPGLLTVVAFVDGRAGSLLPAVRDQMAAYLEEMTRDGRREGLAILLLLSEDPVDRERYERAQRLILSGGRVRVVPWLVDLARDRLFCHAGPPFGIDPDLVLLADPAAEPADEPAAQPVTPSRRLGPLPWATAGLCALLVLIWLGICLRAGSLTATEDGQVLYNWGAALRPSLLIDGEHWRLFTAGFLHIGIAHLAMNTLSLWWVGQMVEALYGPLRMLLIYVVALVAGSAASLMFGPPAILSAGASGAIFGLLGAALWYQLAGPDRERLRRVPLLMVLAINLAYGLVMYRSVDNWNHLGGLVGGFAAAAAVGVPVPEGGRRFRRLLHGFGALLLLALSVGVVMGAVELPGPSQRLAAAMIALDADRFDEAEPGIAEAVRRQPDEPQLRLMLAWVYLNQGRVAEAREQLERVLALDPDSQPARELLQFISRQGEPDSP